MNKRRKLTSWLILAAIVLFAGFALADFNALDKTTHYQNATNGSRVNSTGSALIEDVNAGAWALFPNLIANQFAASGAGLQDSSQAQATYPYSRLALMFTPQFDSLSTVVRVAVQVRGHFSASVDSANTFPWYRFPRRVSNSPTITSAAIVVYAATNTVLHTAAAVTSLGAFTHVPVGYLVIGPGIPVGTYVVSKGTSDSALTMSAAASVSVAANQAITFAPPGSVLANTSSGYSVQDSLGHMQTGSYTVAQQTIANSPYPNANGAWSPEFVVKFNVARQDTADGSGLGKWGAYPKTIYLPLTDETGAWFSAPYTSIRIRVLNGVRSRFNLRVDMVGMK